VNIKSFFTFALLTCFLGDTSWAQTEVFFEDWDTGVVDSGKWKIYSHPGGDAQLYDMNGDGSDWAFYTSTVSPEPGDRHMNAFYSVDTFDRGDNIYCEFIAWGDLSLDGYQGNFPLVAMIGGPWLQFDNPPQHSVWNQEAAVSLWIHQPLRFSQNEWDSGPALTLGYNTEWQVATSKDEAILHRVYLDDALGARFQWSVDGGASWTLEVDSRGIFGGTQLTGLFLGFSSAGSGVLIDDIRVVINDVNPPVPTPPDPNGPGPLLCEDWNTGVIDPGAWTATLQVEDTFNMGQSIGLEEFDPVGFPADYAMHAKGPDLTLTGSDHKTTFFSFFQYPRGDNVFCEFKIWGDETRPGWANSTMGAHYHIGGPWHYDRGSLLFSPEGMIRYWASYAEGPPVLGQEFAQSGDPWTTSPKLSQAYHDAFLQSTSREQCMQIRVELGNANGASCEWKAEGIGITDYQVEYNTLGVPPNAPAVSHISAFVGFGTYSGCMFWDDISVLNNNSSIPCSGPVGPTPTPTHTPVPPLSVENWERLE